MKRRHLLVGFAIVLSISLAVPALGAGGLAGIKALAKKALNAANSAQGTANNAQQAAGTAQEAAKAAQTAASGAASKAATADAAVNGAQDTASAAQGAANTAQGVASAAQSAAGTAQAAANAAQITAAGVATKFGHIEKVVTVGALSPPLGENIKMGVALCPDGSFVVSGGYEFTENTAEVHFDQPIENRTSGGWKVEAQSDGDPFDFNTFAMCLKP